MVYNLTGIGTNTTGLLTFVQGVNNNLMFGWLGILILIGLFVILFTSFMFLTDNIKKAISASSFISLCFALFLKAMSLIPNYALFITIIVTAFAVAFSFISDQ